MLAYTTKKALFPSGGCSSDLIKKPVNQGKPDASCYLCAAADGLAQKLSSPVQSYFLLPAHEGKTLNQKFQLAAMLLEIVWACMKRIIMTEKGCEGELHTSIKCKKEGLTPLQKPRPTGEQITAVQLMYP